VNEEHHLDEPIKLLRKARGLAVNAGAIGITLATATDPDERSAMASALTGFIQRFLETIQAASTHPIVRQQSAEHADALRNIQEFAQSLQSLDATGDYAGLDRDLACKMTADARDRALPAIYVFIRAFEARKAEAEQARATRMAEQANQLEHMFSEVEQIGRMIHLISLNASVEAARAGGERGRSFKVIADEIRSLAAKSAVLIDNTREAIGGTQSANAKIGRHVLATPG